ncbi:MAG TPA: hypothetical protein VLX90_15240, partial [Steroidobacteraceae bacterium]|nr:hypothetical protein [Steroidobacteraceae bacterium]
MSSAAIHKSASSLRGAPYLTDYEAACRSFTWESARAELAGLPGGGLNMGCEALDSQVAAGRGDCLAARFIDRDWHRTDVTYAELLKSSSRFGNLLQSLGVARGECVA